MPVTELGLVAAAGTLGLTGHWVGHGCGGEGRRSAGSLTAPTADRLPPRCCPSPCRAVWAGPLGRPLRGYHCASLFPSSTSGHRQPRLSRLPLPPAHLVELGVGAPAHLGKGGRPVWTGPRRDVASSTSEPGVLGSHISGTSGVQAGAICLQSQGAQGREAARF